MIASLFNGFVFLGSEWVLWLLTVLSICSLAIIFEKFRLLTSSTNKIDSIWESHYLKWNQIESLNPLEGDLKKLATQNAGLASGLAAVILKNKNATLEDKKLLVQSFLTNEKLNLEKKLSFLGTVGSNAPFIGLFGTVLGIIKAFHELGIQSQSGGVQSVSLGLSEALVATAVGLVVAIPAVIFYNIFQRKIKNVLGRLECLANFWMAQKN